MTYFRKLLLLLLFVGSFVLKAQEVRGDRLYSMADDTLVNAIMDNAANELVQLDMSTKYYKPYIREAREVVLSRLEHGHYVKNDSMETNLKRIFNQICTANELELLPVILISDDPFVNAGVNIIGVFEFTMGLLTQVRTEDELAWVVGHEIAHHMNYHAAEVIYDFYNLDVEELQTKEFTRIVQGRGTLEGLKAMQSATYTLQRNRRNREILADSLAMVYLKQAQFDFRGGAAILSQMGYRYLNQEPSGYAVLQGLFSPKYPPMGYWFEPRLPAYDRHPGGFFNKDSVATHPDLQDRLSRLQLVLQLKDSLPERPMQYGPNGIFSQLVESAYSSNSFEACLYLALLGRLRYPEDPFYTTKIGQIFLDLYEAKDDRNSGDPIYRYVDYFTLNLSGNLKEVNAFLYNLQPQEYLEIGYHYLNNPSTFNPWSETHYLLLIRYCELTGRHKIAEQVKKMHADHFPG